MARGGSVESAIQQYVDAVRKSSADLSSRGWSEVERELRQHIAELIDARTSGGSATVQDVYAALAQMDPPEAYGHALRGQDGPRRGDVRLTFLALLCSALQVVGLIAAILGVPVLAGIAGFAAVVAFFLVWANQQSPRWLVRLAGVAAVCGLGLIIMEIVQVL